MARAGSAFWPSIPRARRTCPSPRRSSRGVIAIADAPGDRAGWICGTPGLRSEIFTPRTKACLFTPASKTARRGARIRGDPEPGAPATNSTNDRAEKQQRPGLPPAAFAKSEFFGEPVRLPQLRLGQNQRLQPRIEAALVGGDGIVVKDSLLHA